MATWAGAALSDSSCIASFSVPLLPAFGLQELCFDGSLLHLGDSVKVRFPPLPQPTAGLSRSCKEAPEEDSLCLPTLIPLANSSLLFEGQVKRETDSGFPLNLRFVLPQPPPNF